MTQTESVVLDPGAGVYAHALYEAARDAQREERVGRDLRDVVRALVENPLLVRVLFNPSVPPTAKQNVLRRLAAEGDPLVQSTLLVLLDHGRLGLLPDLERSYAERYQEEHDEIAVQLTTAVPIDDEQAEDLRRRIEQSTGKKVAMRRVVDPAVLGGIVLRVGDLLVDASVRRRLESLRVSLKNTRLPA